MSALTAARNTVRLGPSEVVLGSIDCPLKANAKVYQGAMLALDLTTGYFTQALGATLSLKVVGRFSSQQPFTPVLDNTGGSNGALTARAEQGVFRYGNSSSGDLIASTDVGKPCYVVDDQTVAKTDNGGTRSLAGIIMGVDTAGVFVGVGLQIGSLADAIAGAGEQISASGALAVGKRTSILAVSGTKAYTLADGLFIGQRKSIFCRSATSTPQGVVTPAHPNNFATLTFANANGSAELEWNGTGWDLAGIGGTVTVA